MAKAPRAAVAGLVSSLSDATLRRLFSRPGLSKTDMSILISAAYFQPVTRAEISDIAAREISRDSIARLKAKKLIANGPVRRSPAHRQPPHHRGIPQPVQSQHFVRFARARSVARAGKRAHSDTFPNRMGPRRYLLRLEGYGPEVMTLRGVPHSVRAPESHGPVDRLSQHVIQPFRGLRIRSRCPWRRAQPTPRRDGREKPRGSAAGTVDSRPPGSDFSTHRRRCRVVSRGGPGPAPARRR